MSDKLLNVRIDYIRLDQAVETIVGWLKKPGKYFVVTPNPEMVVDAHFDGEFRKVLNSSDLAIPDSSRLGWGSYVRGQENIFLRLIYSPLFIFPQLLPRFAYPRTTGVDLMEELLSLSEEKAFRTAYLGGSKRVADKLSKCLRLKYPKLKIVFCSGNMLVNEEGMIYIDSERNKMTQSKNISPVADIENRFNHHQLIEKIDILFVAFGHKKQEKWMYKNLSRLNTKVMVGVGGSFDYLAGEVPRAPQILRQAGLEWLFRIVIQPWRIKRFWKLIYYVYMVLFSK